MKKILFAIVAAALVSTQAMAQDEISEQRPERKFDKTEMVKHRTDETVSRYKLSDKQAKQLLELNTKFADKMGPRGPRPGGHHGRPGVRRPPMPPSDAQGQRPEGQRDDSKMKERRAEMEKTMKEYEAELQKIMTADQYKSYQEDQKKMRKRVHRPRRAE
jgi:hypothetical protein